MGALTSSSCPANGIGKGAWYVVDYISDQTLFVTWFEISAGENFDPRLIYSSMQPTCALQRRCSRLHLSDHNACIRWTSKYATPFMENTLRCCWATILR